MHAFTEKDIRTSFINASLRERNSLIVPDLRDIEWDKLDYFGWRDPKQPLAGFMVVPIDDGPVGILLRQTEQRTRTRAQCSWCEDVTLPNEVVMFSAKRAGKAGRNGDTVGTLLCENFECSVNVRRPVPPAYLGFDVAAARDRRIAALREHAAGFARDIRDSA
ncbi:FBP domain-containing protein [Microbacterium jejuense]|uniref:FBP domain-containing protein n=1 Tax=Microbacterium jejuense TaxID=1263637 RepID=UPI0031E5C5E0